jgi:hypothetical protein
VEWELPQPPYRADYAASTQGSQTRYRDEAVVMDSGGQMGRADDPFFKAESDQRTVNNTMRHQYRVLSDQEKEAMLRIKDWGANGLNVLQDCVPPGRERSLAITKLEECVMWAVKGLTG